MYTFTSFNNREICIFWLKQNGCIPDVGTKAGVLSWSNGYRTSMTVDYAFSISKSGGILTLVYNNSNNELLAYEVKLDRVQCNLGGYRWYFICPLKHNNSPCERRVAKLYLGSRYYGCRKCLQLRYRSTSESKKMRKYPFDQFIRQLKADELIQTIKRKKYKGKLTRKYKRYKALDGEVERIDINELLCN